MISALSNYQGQYINYTPIKELTIINDFLQDKHYSNLKNPTYYIKKILDYEKSRNHSSKIFAISLLVMIPKYLNKNDKHIIIKNFMLSISFDFKNKKIPYIYRFSKVGNGSYVEIIVFEREVFTNKKDIYIEDVYLRDMRINKFSGKTTNKADPDAILICKKGEVKVNVDGTPIKKVQYVSEKKRYFQFNDNKKNETKKKANFIRFIDHLKERVINSISKVISFRPFIKLKSKQYSRSFTENKRIKILNYNQRINDINYALINIQKIFLLRGVIYDKYLAYTQFYRLVQSLIQITNNGYCKIGNDAHSHKIKINPSVHMKFKYFKQTY